MAEAVPALPSSRDAPPGVPGFKGAWVPHARIRAALYVVLAGFVVAVITGLWRTQPRLLAQWSRDDGLFETLSPIVLLVGVVLSVLLARVHRRNGDERAWGWFGFSMLLGILCMEEIGWGYEIFAYPRPEVEGIPVDSLHDLLRLLRRLGNRERTLFFQALGGVGVICTGGILLSPWGRSRWRAINANILLLLVLSAVPIAGAVLFDARLTDLIWFLRNNPPYGLEESLELLSEATLVTIVIEGWAASRSRQRHAPNDPHGA